MAVLLGEHRLERCLAAADRVIALEAGAITFDGAPGDFLDWALDADPVLDHPGRAAADARRACRPRRASARPGGRSEAQASTPNVPRTAPRSEPSGTFAGRKDAVALAFRDVWVELGAGEERTEALRGVDLRSRAAASGSP